MSATLPRLPISRAAPLLGLLAALLLPLGAEARDLYVLPGAEAAPDGSRAAPYASIGAALQARDPGDGLVLMTGEYGTITLNGEYDPPLEIRSEEPGGAHAIRLFVPKGRGMRISGLSLWPLVSSDRKRDLIESRGADIRFSDLDLRGRADAPETYMDWVKEDWTKTWRVNGIRMSGPDNAILNSRFTALAFAIQSGGDGGEVRGNHISGFSGDAMRGLGDDTVVDGNYVENSFKVDGNHDDGFQAWARKPDPNRPGGKLQKNLTVSNNTIYAWTGPEGHPLHRQKADLQGIGLFDGRFENVTIENNLVVVNQYHGITLADGHNSRILNNTVVHRSGLPDQRPWISLGSKWDDPEALKTVVVANNVAMAFRKIADPSRRNAVVKFPAKFFVDPLKGDFRPLPGGPLFGAGDADLAPRRDIQGHSRPADVKVTLGAFETD